MIPTQELTEKPQETPIPEQATETIEDAVKNRVIAYCYKVPREEEIQHTYEYVTLDKRLFQLWIKMSCSRQEWISRRVGCDVTPREEVVLEMGRGGDLTRARDSKSTPQAN